MAATLASSMAAAVSAKSLSSKASIVGSPVAAPQPVSVVKVAAVQVRASAEESVSRRAALGLIAGAAALTLKASPSLAAFGEAANVFGKAPANTDYIPYKGDGFSIDIPAKWNPSKEFGEFPGVVLRYEDNFDALCNLTVIVQPTSLNSVADLGSAKEFLTEYNYLLGVQAFSKDTISEGGFAPGAAVSSNILDSSLEEAGGETYLKVNVLTRTADGNEGGRHQLFAAAVKGGNLYIARLQAGDKRWFKGAKKFVEGAWNSFAVA